MLTATFNANPRHQITQHRNYLHFFAFRTAKMYRIPIHRDDEIFKELSYFISSALHRTALLNKTTWIDLSSIPKLSDESMLIRNCFKLKLRTSWLDHGGFILKAHHSPLEGWLKGPSVLPIWLFKQLNRRKTGKNSWSTINCSIIAGIKPKTFTSQKKISRDLAFSVVVNIHGSFTAGY